MPAYTMRPDGIELRGAFKKRFFAWRDIAGFWLKEGRPLGGVDPATFIYGSSSDEGWMTVRGGDQFCLKGVNTDDQILELNRLLERGRRGVLLDPTSKPR